MTGQNPPPVRELRNAMVEAGPACDGADPELFTGPDAFEDENEPIAARLKREKQAKRICHTCPARPECLAYALAVRPEDGVWAGLTAARIRLMSIRSLVSGEEVA